MKKLVRRCSFTDRVISRIPNFVFEYQLKRQKNLGKFKKFHNQLSKGRLLENNHPSNAIFPNRKERFPKQDRKFLKQEGNDFTHEHKILKIIDCLVFLFLNERKKMDFKL